MKNTKSKVIKLAGIVFLIFAAWCLQSYLEQMGEQGFRQSKREEGDSGQNSGSEGQTGELAQEQSDTAEEKKERIIVENTDYTAIDNTLYSWWFKRNDNHEKSGCQEDFDITEYQAYYTVPVSEKKIYITFDCGYENGYTADILDTLKEATPARCSNT